jgi:hypothetical protein
LGSTRKVVKLGEIDEKMEFTPLSQIKVTLTSITSNTDDINMMSVSNAGDIMMMSPSQKEELLNTIISIPNIDTPESKTTAIVAVMRGKPKHGHHRHCSNKHHKQKLVQVLLDSGPDGNPVIINKDKPMLLPS